MQFLRQEKFIGIDQVISGFFVFCEDFFKGKGRIGDVGFLTFGKWAAWVEIVVGIDLAEF